MQATLYVGNLGSHSDPRPLTRLFRQYGTVVRAQVFEAEDLIHRRGGFGLVEMSSHAEAETAIRALDGAEQPGGAIAVRWASPHELASAHGPRLFGPMNMIDQGDDNDDDDKLSEDGNDDKDGYGEDDNDKPLPSRPGQQR